MTYEIFVPFWGDPQQLYETVESVRAVTGAPFAVELDQAG